MDNSILLSIVFMLVVIIIAGFIYLFLNKQSTKDKLDTSESSASMGGEPQVSESYADAGGMYALQNASAGASCGCSGRLCSDLSNCCAKKYPIDLPFPESVAAPAPACSGCAETLKYVLE